MDYGGLKKKYLSRLKKLSAREAGGVEMPPREPEEEPQLQATSPAAQMLSRTASVKVLLDLEEDALNSYSSMAKYGSTDLDGGEEKEFVEVEKEFFFQLEKNAQKVESFYQRMELELGKFSKALVRHASSASKKPAAERTNLLASLRRRYVEHYLEIAELLNFAELNKTGFEKILKKHDKITMLNRKDDFMRSLSQYKFSHPGTLESLRQNVEEEFARCYWNDDVDNARNELQESLRDLVIWERNTIWRDMLLSERRVRAVTSKKAGKAGKVWLTSLRPAAFLLSLTMFLGVMILAPSLFSMLPNIGHYNHASIRAAQRCLSLVVFVSFLWATEAVPLYVTALAVPTLSVLLHVFLTENGKLMPAQEAAKLAISSMSSSVILLIIGGYSLAAALSKFALDKTVATIVLARAGRPSQVLLLLMLLAVFLSMWISNVATPVLLNSLMLPVIRGFPPNSLPLAKCLLLGIALASNIGGMGTPIASPQNAIALNSLEGMQQISFVQWLAISIPMMLIMVLLCHALLMAWFRPGRYSLPILPSHMEKLNSSHYMIIVTLMVTISLWCCKPAVSFVGSDGIISCLPILIFFGTGLLSKEDFNNLPWNVIYLVAGGVALGTAVQSSQLLRIVGGAITIALNDSSLWMICIVFCTFIFVVSSATSHTVSAIIIMPLMAEVGAGLGHPRLLVMGGALACSCAMALPVSSFPNTASVCVENEIGKAYLHPVDILRLGVIMTLIAAVILLTFGYVLMLLMGF